jgi:hypothetical protein
MPYRREIVPLQDIYLPNFYGGQTQTLHCLQPGVVIYVTTDYIELFFKVHTLYLIYTISYIHIYTIYYILYTVYELHTHTLTHTHIHTGLV